MLGVESCTVYTKHMARHPACKVSNGTCSAHSYSINAVSVSMAASRWKSICLSEAALLVQRKGLDDSM